MKYPARDEYVRISGRCSQENEGLFLGFSGSFVEFEMTGDELKIGFVTDDPVMREDPNSEWYKPDISYCDETYFGHAAVIVDGNYDSYTRIALTTPELEATVKLSSGRHIIRVVKLNEAAFGCVGIAYIDIPGDIAPVPTKPLGKKIEFVGDSITCGYGNEGLNGVDIFTTSQQNPLDAYAIKTARKLNAEYQLVSWSGIGIISDYVDPSKNEPDETILMPVLYPYTDRRLDEKRKRELRKWDFAKYVPDVIVLFLGTNDASYTRSIPEREEHMAREYAKFLEYLHEKNPTSDILAILGTMETSLCATEEKVVESFAKAHPEIKAQFMALPLQDEADGLGADSHPSKITHEKVATLVSEKLSKDFNL
ncbi:MAG: hypothetical protein KBS85_01960 [Lachnospiraceae bacterium]|nr:hypothetical protein [Candidatus Merdinaster equi]